MGADDDYWMWVLYKEKYASLSHLTTDQSVQNNKITF